DGALGEDVGLAAEAADPLGAANEAREPQRADAIELRLRRTVLEDSGQLLVHSLGDLGQVIARLGRGVDVEQAGDLAVIEERADPGGSLIVVDEALVEA